MKEQLNYFYTIEGSQYFTNLDQIIEWMRHKPELNEQELNYLRVGICNSIKQGYKLEKYE
jgi:hypothetical protein